MMRVPRSSLAFLLAALTCIAAHPAVPDKDTSTWWGHIKILASDEFQGRLTGSPGYAKAAEYVASEFKREGLKPAGTEGYYQDVGFEVQSIQTATSRVLLVPEKAAPVD